ncbi:zinc-ribbon domain-containing protein [Enterovirga sp.]|uniref:zinc-ribbon domain-containing protein n=1 Tax=Enterovirga sp. TaxID=2026350 RepID=UPI0026289A66|nr:zinc-ribbon domain-containing protein [Enterovirga sp.]MDB5591620.1 hypothetical protein [Enterovirga sp.]
MIITCPSCASTYEIAADRIGSGGRKVRCAACRESWFTLPRPQDGADQSPGAEDDRFGAEAAAPSPPTAFAGDRVLVIEPEPHAIVPRALAARAKPVRRKKPGSGRGKPGQARIGRSVGMAAAMLLVLLLPPALLLRGPIVAALPGTATLFSALGLPVNLVGLDLAATTSTLDSENGAPVLIVGGEIVNPTGRTLAVPPLEMVIEGEAGDMLYAWSVQPPQGELAPKMRATFRARLASPPPAGRQVVVRFRHPGRGKVALR